jgi:hypothetical protein
MIRNLNSRREKNFFFLKFEIEIFREINKIFIFFFYNFFFI